MERQGKARFGSTAEISGLGLTANIPAANGYSVAFRFHQKTHVQESKDMSQRISFKAFADGAAEDRTSPLSVANRASKILLLVLVFAGGLCVPGLLAAQPDASISYVSQFGKEGVVDGEFRHPMLFAWNGRAEWLGGEFWTADKRLTQAVQASLSWVHLVE